MRKIIFTILFLVCVALNISGQSKITDEEYLIYSTVFESVYSKSKSEIQIVLLDNTAGSSKNSFPLEHHLNTKTFTDTIYRINPHKGISPQKIEELVKSYNDKNLNPGTVKSKLKIKNRYVIIPQSELDKLLIEGRKIYDEMPNKPVDDLHSPMITWKPFLKKYRTNGCYHLSKVGFSKDKNFALVFVSQTDGISGGDMFYILEKTNGRWENPKRFGSGWII